MAPPGLHFRVPDGAAGAGFTGGFHFAAARRTELFGTVAIHRPPRQQRR